MKQLLVVLPLALALSACNQFAGQGSEFAAMGKGSIAQDPSSSPDTTIVVTDGGSFGGVDGGSGPKVEVVVTDGGSFGGVDGGSEPKVEVVVTDGGSFGGVDGGSEPKVEVVVTDGGAFGGVDGGSNPQKITEVPVQKPLCHSYGLKGILWDASLLSKSPKFDDAVKDGVRIDSPVYLPELNFFRQEHPGFKISDNEFIRNQSGEILKEKYGLELTSEITLSSEDEEGYYQIGYFGEDQFSVEVDGKIMATPKNGFTQGPSTKFRFFIEKGQTLLQFKLEKGKKYALKIQTSQNKKDDYAAVLLWRRVRGLEEPYKDLPQKQYSGNNSNEDLKSIINEDSEENPWSILKNMNYLHPDQKCNS